MSNPYYLSAADSLPAAKPVLTLGQGYPTHIKNKVGDVEQSIPVSYWRKDAIALERYKHPTTNAALDVTPAAADEWVRNFHAMKAAGIRIPAPAGHSDDPRDNMGWVEDVALKDGRISLLVQAVGEDGALVASRNECSLKIDPNYIDEKGKKWGSCIVHAAFTPKPVITGMGSFVPFAASRDRQTETPIYYLSAEKGDPEMDLKALREALGAAADVPDDKLPDLAVQRLTALKTDAQTALSRATTAETRVTELSRTPAAPDPEILRDRMELSRSKIDLAVERGDMPPFIADKLKGKVGDAAKPSVFMLSRSDDLGDRPVDFVLSLFDGAKLNPKTGSVTGVQVLSRDIPGDDTEKPPTKEQIDAHLAQTATGRRYLASQKK
jgi:hypothetical protein